MARYDLERQLAFAQFTEMACDEIEASDLSLFLRRARVRERLVEIEQAFVVPEPAGALPGAATLLAAAALGRRRRGPFRSRS